MGTFPRGLTSTRRGQDTQSQGHPGPAAATGAVIDGVRRGGVGAHLGSSQQVPDLPSSPRLAGFTNDPRRVSGGSVRNTAAQQRQREQNSGDGPAQEIRLFPSHLAPPGPTRWSAVDAPVEPG